MKRLLLLSLILIVLCLSCIQASAHSSKTDASGGHYDSSTGEYHYHHGYPEHQHTDTNGDGILECPYRKAFIEKPKDETTSSHFETETPKIEKVPTEDPTDPQKQETKSYKKIPTGVIGAIVLGVIFGGGFVADWISDAVKRKREK